MSALVIGASDSASTLAESLRAEGVQARVAESDPDGDNEIALLAHELIHLEGVLGTERPEAVVLADAGERALAGVLVATKLLIPVAALERSQGANRDLIAHLADRMMPTDAGEIAAWIAAAPKLPRP
jgi:hypothetical protein